MANKPVKMHLIRRLIQLMERGYSERSMAKELSISRPTIRSYKNRLEGSGKDYHTLKSLSDEQLSNLVYPAVEPAAKDDTRRLDIESRMDYLLSELKRKHVSRRLLWEEYIIDKPDGYGFTQFCLLLARRSSVVEPVMTLHYKAGEKVMVDFAGDKLSYTDKQTAEVHECPVLVCTLPYSNYSYVEVLNSGALAHLIAALNNMLYFLGGCPKVLKTDNMRQVVVRASRYEPIFTEAIQQWGLHNDIVIEATGVRRPREKAPVERQVAISYQHIYAPLRNHTFFSLAELNQAVRKMVDIFNDRIMQGRKVSRRALFEQEEKSLLQPLAVSAYILLHQSRAKVQRNYHVTLGEDWVHYSVPYQYIGKEVYLSYDSDWVEVFLALSMERIAFHRRSYKRHAHVSEQSHMPANHRAYQQQLGYTPEYFISKGAHIGPSTQKYITSVLQSKQFTEQTFNACLGIIRLEARYGKDRIEAACLRAAGGPRYNYRTILTILENNRDKEAIQTEIFRLPDHDNIRGADAYK